MNQKCILYENSLSAEVIADDINFYIMSGCRVYAYLSREDGIIIIYERGN